MIFVIDVIVASVLVGGLWEVEAIETQGAGVVDVAYANDGSALFCVLGDTTIQKVNVDDGQLVWSRESERRCDQVAVSPSDNSVATAGAGNHIDIRNGDSGEVINSINTPPFYFNGVNELQFVNGGNAVLAAGPGGRIIYADISTGETKRFAVNHGEDEWPRVVSAWAVSDELKLAAAATRYSLTRFVQFAPSDFAESIGNVECCPLHVPIPAVAFSGDGRILVTAATYMWDHELIIWNVDRPDVAEAARIDVPYYVYDIFFAEGNDKVYVVSSVGVSSWDLGKKVESGRLVIEDWSVGCAAYCPVRHEIAVGSRQGTIMRIVLSENAAN